MSRDRGGSRHRGAHFRPVIAIWGANSGPWSLPLWTALTASTAVVRPRARLTRSRPDCRGGTHESLVTPGAHGLTRTIVLVLNDRLRSRPAPGSTARSASGPTHANSSSRCDEHLRTRRLSAQGMGEAILWGYHFRLEDP
jgi:hypothetical protein